MDSAELLDILGNENRRRILRLLARKPCYVTEISEYLGVSPKAVIDHLQRLDDAGLVESRTDDRRRKYFSISRNLRLEVSVSPYEFGMKSAYPASANLDVSRCRRVSLDVQFGDVQGSGDGAGDAEDRATPNGGTDAASEPSTSSNAKSDGDATSDAGATPDVDAESSADVDAESSATPEAESDPAESATRLASELDELQQLQNELSLAQRWVHGRIADVQKRLGDALDANGERRLHADVLAAVAGGATTRATVSRAVEAPEGVVEECLRELADRELVEREGEEWTLAG
uniref:ArsR/SmtB family transcription factor n=1 Tax=Halorussus halobius TaxID=1710537 RepID=UPI001092978D